MAIVGVVSVTKISSSVYSCLGCDIFDQFVVSPDRLSVGFVLNLVQIRFLVFT